VAPALVRLHVWQLRIAVFRVLAPAIGPAMSHAFERRRVMKSRHCDHGISGDCRNRAGLRAVWGGCSIEE